ncbi:MAG: tRNA (N(6)-L-threonylcarbamoyladenosine(37)-C(2))-methylthiotransferase MtaB [Clostridiales bacterium]|jgi:threonylcarbamoyladenosine tRNA methylthiotransferase MtaB|nr:tRNA (N(6)-L-threonylcarbamoyladenosine(37)-C(2))-methylthiotransferase MtaB [Clostridiales bacterium]
MNYSIVTLGCKVNQYESQAMGELLLQSGFTPAADQESCDIIIINSCTVTATSDQKVRQLLRRSRRNHPDAVLVLTGCMPQAFPDVAQRFEEADIVLGNSSRRCLPSYITAFLSHHQRIVDIKPHQDNRTFEPLSVNQFHERTRAFVKIEDGCNRFCSYCIIPYARGRVRSKPLDQLKQELCSLVQSGYQEVVLVGINLSAYGQDLGLHLCDAVECACGIDGIERVRLGSLEPEQMDNAVVERLSRLKKLCPQFHLSLQSGCDETLQRMNRHYTASEYTEIVGNLRKHFPNCSITTDIMVGFPGETEEEFRRSLAFAEQIGFSKAHVFAYSPRPGTRAAEAQGQLTNSVKENRSRQMIALTLKTRAQFLSNQVNKIEQVLFETACKDGIYEGYTENYTPVRVESPVSLCGKLLSVRLTRAGENWCEGVLSDGSIKP